jgi:NADH:ubiquinone oxidoreductase subunit F (NADH-binding)
MSSAPARDLGAASGGVPRLLAAAAAGRTETLREHLARLGMPPASGDLIAAVEAAGLRGRGGAGFPTGRKLHSVAAQRRRPIVVANGAEGEPASKKDKALIRLAPHLVLDGAALAAEAVGAREAVIAVSSRATVEQDVLARAMGERGRLDRVRLRTAAVPDAFVSGEETALIQGIEGRAPRPTLKPPYPFVRGLDGAPTLVQNVETLAHIALIARFGPGWFRAAGSDDAPGTALVTLSGAVARRSVYEVELGSSLAGLVGRAGGASEEISAFLVGGYFGRWIPGAAAAGLRLTPDVLGAGAIVAFPAHSCALAECARVVRYLADESAGQCGPCVHGLAAIARALASLAGGAAADRRAEAQIHRWSEQVRGRGACRHPDGAAGFVQSALAAFDREVELHVRHGSCRRPQRVVLPLPSAEAA